MDSEKERSYVPRREISTRYNIDTSWRRCLLLAIAVFKMTGFMKIGLKRWSNVTMKVKFRPSAKLDAFNAVKTAVYISF
jgi:hypothetical protein